MTTQPETQPQPDTVTEEDLDAMFERLSAAQDEAPEDAKEPAKAEAKEDEEIPLEVILRTFYIKKALADHAAELLKDERPGVQKALLKEWRRNRSKSFDVTIHDTDGNEHKIGTTTLPKTVSKNIATDPDTLKDWLEAHGHEDLIVTEEIPPQEARTVKTPRPEALDILVKEKHLKVVNGEIIDPGTGEAVSFARHEPAAEPSSFTAGMGGTGKPGQAKILELLEESGLEGVAITDLLKPQKAISSSRKK